MLTSVYQVSYVKPKVLASKAVSEQLKIALILE